MFALTIIDAIERQSALRPHHIALTQESAQLSYQELRKRSQETACRLVSTGVQSGDSIGLLSDRSIDAIVAMLGCLCAGAVIVPIDPTYPDERIQYLLNDANARLLLCDRHNHARAIRFVDDQLPLLQIDQGNRACVVTEQILLQRPEAKDRAYIMYTSGSTGQPKGVAVSHAALWCYCQADAAVYKLSSHDRTLQFSTFSFDISIEEIFPPLATGSTVVLRPAGRSDSQIELSDIISQYEITAVHLATAYWHEWVDLMTVAGVCIPDSLRLMVVTGEKVSPEHYQRWLRLCNHNVLWANAYGPTETTVTATVFIPPANWQGSTMPIGKPLPGYTAHILDGDMQPVKTGKTGELYIGGAALAEGYLNRPEQTAQAFVTSPFAAGTNSADNRLYRTGDLARWLPDGNIDYAGRVDHQVKIGSYRVEPGEVENAINTCPAVKDVLVQGVTIDGQQLLAAYVALSDHGLTVSELATRLESLLPAYCLPSRYFLLESLPKTLNGKIDRKALPDIRLAQIPGRSDFREPATELERSLCEIWRNVLGTNAIGLDDSFIAMGGDSLSAVRLITRINTELGRVISTRDFFYLDTIALVAGHLEGKAVERTVPAPQPSFINTRQRQVYTVLQRPPSGVCSGHGLLLVPPIGNEQRRIQRPWRILMQNLSRQGHTLIRFDWQGTGNSSGNSEQLYSIEAWQADIEDAAHALNKSVDSLDIVAVRAGALIAAFQPLSGLAVRQRIYWEPVLRGADWIRDMRSLHSGILSDLHRYLFHRKPRNDSLEELTGLLLQPAMVACLKEIDMADAWKLDWNKNALVLLADSQKINNSMPSSIQLVDVEDQNAWYNPRSTTDDMLINKAASVIARQLPVSG